MAGLASRKAGKLESLLCETERFRSLGYAPWRPGRFFNPLWSSLKSSKLIKEKYENYPSIFFTVMLTFVSIKLLVY